VELNPLTALGQFINEEAATEMGSRLHAPDAYSLAIQQTGREKPLFAPVLPKTQ
jgi:hypothetical protein